MSVKKVIHPLNSNQLFDPFSGKFPASGLPSAVDFPIACSTPKSIDVFGVYLSEIKDFPNPFLKKTVRTTFYDQNKYKPNVLVRRRAYEFAYCEFKRGVVATSGNSAGPRISTSPGGGVPPYQEITGAYNAAWCASFTSWCFYQAGFKTIKNTPANLALAKTWGQAGLIGKDPEGWPLRIREITAKEVVAGDLVVFGLETDDYENDHVGMFSRWIEKPWETPGKRGLFTSIEGNTGPDIEVIIKSKGNYGKGAAGTGGRGVYGKKHSYNLSNRMDDLVLNKTVTFGRIFAER
jgi:hypothetical protein